MNAKVFAKLMVKQSASVFTISVLVIGTNAVFGECIAAKEERRDTFENQFMTTFRNAGIEAATNQEIAASIIGFIRQLALGSPLMAYRERVERALKKILSSRPWTAPATDPPRAGPLGAERQRHPCSSPAAPASRCHRHVPESSALSTACDV